MRNLIRIILRAKDRNSFNNENESITNLEEDIKLVTLSEAEDAEDEMYASIVELSVEYPAHVTYGYALPTLQGSSEAACIGNHQSRDLAAVLYRMNRDGAQIADIITYLEKRGISAVTFQVGQLYTTFNRYELAQSMFFTDYVYSMYASSQSCGQSS